MCYTANVIARPALAKSKSHNFSAKIDQDLGSASERAKGRGAVWPKSGHSAQYYYCILLARSGMGEGERANTRAFREGASRGWPGSRGDPRR